jgi:hypothetical protein
MQGKKRKRKSIRDIPSQYNDEPSITKGQLKILKQGSPK